MDAPAPASPMAQEEVEDLRRQVEASKGELERLQHDRKQISEAVREQMEVWLQCCSDEYQKQMFEQHASADGTLAIENLACCLADLGIKATGRGDRLDEIAGDSTLSFEEFRRLVQRSTQLGGWVSSAMPLAELVAYALPFTTHWSPDVFKEELWQLDKAKIKAVCSIVS